jgi:hypothetical protein
MDCCPKLAQIGPSEYEDPKFGAPAFEGGEGGLRSCQEGKSVSFGAGRVASRGRRR